MSWNNPKYLKAVRDAKQFQADHPELIKQVEVYLQPYDQVSYDEMTVDQKMVRCFYRGGKVMATIGNICMRTIHNRAGNTFDWWVFVPEDMQNEN